MRRHGSSLLAIDITGGFIVAACAASIVWLTVLREDRAPAMIRELSKNTTATRNEIAKAKTQRDEQQALLTTRRGELANRGQLPEQSPVEAYFQTLARLAAQNRLQVRGQGPLSPRTYPGMLEQRFSYEVAGSLPDLARFLSAIESSDAWADVSFFKIETVRGAGYRLDPDGGRT